MIGDQRDGLRIVQRHTALQPAAGDIGGDVHQEFVLLVRRQVHAQGLPPEHALTQRKHTPAALDAWLRRPSGTMDISGRNTPRLGASSRINHLRRIDGIKTADRHGDRLGIVGTRLGIVQGDRSAEPSQTCGQTTLPTSRSMR